MTWEDWCGSVALALAIFVGASAIGTVVHQDRVPACRARDGVYLYPVCVGVQVPKSLDWPYGQGPH